MRRVCLGSRRVDGSPDSLPTLECCDIFGVEVGQITIAAIVLPIVWQLRKNEKFLRVGVPALFAIVAAAGLYWFLERTIFA